ncbi:MAG: CPBP family intramembrane glutamic endopeptidase [Steroidobacteraceae bacterium]
MRTLLIFIGLIALGFAAMALLSYPAWQLLHPHFDFAFHRIASRIGMLVLLLGMILAARPLGLRRRADFGYSGSARAFMGAVGRAFVLGVATMLPVVALMWWLDLRTFRDLDWHAASLLDLALSAALTGFAVALLEETLLRGALFTAMQRDSGTRFAIVATALLYAAAHFIGRVRIPADAVDAGSGIDVISGSLAAFASPLAIVDAFLALTALGLLLAWIRHLTGNIAACIGLHAGWVFINTAWRSASDVNPGANGAWLLSQHDGVVGYLVLGSTAVIAWLLTLIYRRAS